MKKHNFSAGPCILPQDVLKKASEAILDFNNDNLIFHRVWSSPLTKKNSLQLCDQFKLKNITCILQVNK